MAKEYVFLDEWDVDAPQDAVFDALADARTYPDWWKPVYIEVEGDEAPAEGVTTRQHFKGKLPYTLKTTSKITRFDPPTHFQVEVVGDLTGTGKWTLGPNGKRPGPCPLRLDRACRSAAPPLPHPDHAADLPLEPQLVRGTREGGAAALRAISLRIARAGQRRQIVSRAHARAPVALSAHLLVRIPLGLPHRRPGLTRGLGRVALPAPLRLARASSARSSTGAPASGGSARPAWCAPVSRRYEPGTNVLETTWMTGSGWVMVRDALTLGDWRPDNDFEPHRRPPPDDEAEHVLIRTGRMPPGRGRHRDDLPAGLRLRGDQARLAAAGRRRHRRGGEPR